MNLNFSKKKIQMLKQYPVYLSVQLISDCQWYQPIFSEQTQAPLSQTYIAVPCTQPYSSSWLMLGSRKDLDAVGQKAIRLNRYWKVTLLHFLNSQRWCIINIDGFEFFYKYVCVQFLWFCWKTAGYLVLVDWDIKVVARWRDSMYKIKIIDFTGYIYRSIFLLRCYIWFSKWIM